MSLLVGYAMFVTTSNVIENTKVIVELSPSLKLPSVTAVLLTCLFSVKFLVRFFGQAPGEVINRANFLGLAHRYPVTAQPSGVPH